MSSINDYLDLVTSQHRDKANFTASLTAAIQPFVDAINQLVAMSAKFDLDTATAAQLDVIGAWVGLSRQLKVPISGVYFAFDTPGVGFDQGVWFNSEEPAEGVINLDDGTYRLMIKAKIAANVWDGSLGDANSLLAAAFPDASVELQDNMNMTQTFIVSGTSPSTLFQQLVQQGYIQLRPAGVNIV